MPIKRLFHTNIIIFISIVLFALSACTGSKNVVTSDNSVEYRNAITLPPLKKPSRSQSQQNSNQTSKVEPIIAPVNIIDNNDGVNEPVVADIEPSREVDELENVIEEVDPEENYNSNDYSEQVSPIRYETNIVNARVIEPNANTARLQIEEDFIGAWKFLSDNLKRSNITVYNKNQTAQSFAIGCGEMEDEQQVTKRGGWSFFNKKPQKTEHCSLQLASTKANTTVAVLSRSGEEVAASAAKDLFSRLLNN